MSSCLDLVDQNNKDNCREKNEQLGTPFCTRSSHQLNIVYLNLIYHSLLDPYLSKYLLGEVQIAGLFFFHQVFQNIYLSERFYRAEKILILSGRFVIFKIFSCHLQLF